MKASHPCRMIKRDVFHRTRSKLRNEASTIDVVSKKKRTFSIVVPTYNRLPILKKCLEALEQQRFSKEEEDWKVDYEVVVVDDGSTDGTVEHLKNHADLYPHVRLLESVHGGAAMARNIGVSSSKGDVIVFIDSDLVVVPTFLDEHARSLFRSWEERGDERTFTYGRVINTDNFMEPESEPFKVTDRSAAFFATGNVAIAKSALESCSLFVAKGEANEGSRGNGPFDTEFTEYGWEDLELGERLRKNGVSMKRCPDAIGYHYHPAFRPEDVPELVEREKQRGRGGARFYLKHPNLHVRLMVQMTPFHLLLWSLLTLFGRLNEMFLDGTIKWLCRRGKHRAALWLLSPILNWHCVVSLHQELFRLRSERSSSSWTDPKHSYT